ncbi:hypothetical protein CLAIMM_13671, partial [Cladophialophora immunda]
LRFFSQALPSSVHLYSVYMAVYYLALYLAGHAVLSARLPLVAVSHHLGVPFAVITICRNMSCATLSLSNLIPTFFGVSAISPRRDSSIPVSETSNRTSENAKIALELAFARRRR